MEEVKKKATKTLRWELDEDGIKEAIIKYLAIEYGDKLEKAEVILTVKTKYDFRGDDSGYTVSSIATIEE